MSSDPSETRAPTSFELLPILPIVLVVTSVARGFEPRPWVGTSWALATAGAAAALIGWPAAFWLLDHGYRRLGPMLLAGAGAGVIPLLLALLSGIVGLVLRHGMHDMLSIVALGAPIPAIGLERWPAFIHAELMAAAIGLASAGLYWAGRRVLGN